DKWDDVLVKVDRKVYNPARIWKLYGTLAAKGDAIPGRPHRLSRILEAPEQVQIVPRDALELLATTRDDIFDELTRGPGPKIGLRDWLAKHGIEVASEKPWKGGTLYTLALCPFNADHTNQSAYAIQHRNGGISAGCHHNSCQGKGWRDLRQ